MSLITTILSLVSLAVHSAAALSGYATSGQVNGDLSRVVGYAGLLAS